MHHRNVLSIAFTEACLASPPPTSRKQVSTRPEIQTPAASNLMEDTSKTPMAPRGSQYSCKTYIMIAYFSIFTLCAASNRFDYGRKLNAESFDEATPRRDNVNSFHDQYVSTPSNNSVSLLDIGSSRNVPARTPLPPSPQTTNMHYHRDRSHRDSPPAFPTGGHDSDADSGFPESEQKGKSPTWETSPLVRSRSTSPLQPTQGHLNVDHSYTSHYSKEERRRSQQSISRDDSTGHPATEEEKDIEHHQSLSSFAKSSREATYNARRTSSLRAIDNTYHHADPNLQRSSRTPSPLFSPPLSPPKNTSTTPPSTSKKAKLQASSSAQKLAFNDRSSKRPAQNLSDYKETIQPSGTRNSESRGSHSDEDEDDYRRESPSQRTPRPSKAQNAPRGLVEEHTPPKSLELDLSTPSSRQKARASRAQFRPLSVDDSSELPTPSSDDESERKSWNPAATPVPSGNGRQEHSWLPTPRPPGGWLQTPVAPRNAHNFDKNVRKPSTTLDDDTEGDGEIYAPETPAKALGSTEERYMAKTPRPPGAWQTPAPSTVSRARFQASSASPEDVQAQGLLTPVSSIPKGSFYDPKTPYVPGGWAATPAARKSVMKVRFNQETEISPTENASSSAMQNGEHHRKHAENGDLDVRSSSSRSPRKLQTPSIRIMDAFGREQIDDDTPMAGAVDPNARTGPVGDEVKDDDEDLPNPSRRDLLSRIRRGLDDLVEDVDEIER